MYLGTGVFESKNATHSYNLKIFYKDNGENQNDEQEKKYAGSVTISQGSYLDYDSLLNFKLHVLSKDTPAFAGPIKRSQVESIELVGSINIPNNVIYSWDVSEKQNGSVVAYTLDEDNNGLYELYIGQEGKVVLPSNSSSIFSYFNKLKQIDLSYIDTSKVTDISGMFINTQVTILDLSSFDLSGVTNMKAVFRDSSISIGYARTQADADRLNASSNKPTGLTFTVKN